MVTPSLPRSVARFIRDHIHSVSQLEVLLLLRERGGEWSPASVSAELRITDDSAELRLHDLQLRAFLRYDARTQRYSYSPDAPRLRSLVDELATCYFTMRHTVITEIYSVPGDSARTLAEAFRFRRRRE